MFIFLELIFISENKYLIRLKNIIPICLPLLGTLDLPKPFTAEKKGWSYT